MQDQLNNLERSLGRVEGKLDGIVSQLEKFNATVIDHDKRIDGITQEVVKAKGIAAGISMVVSVIGAVVTIFIKRIIQ